MTYVITQACCNDASCVAVCPVDCIHPTPDEAPFMTTEMLYIDPASCIDCAACVFECPVDAIVSSDDLEDDARPYLDINASFYTKYPIGSGGAAQPNSPKKEFDFSSLRVAIVGSGPAGSYAAGELLRRRGVEVNMFDRLLTPYGLIRSGVAPDHPGTKAITDVFRSMGTMQGYQLHLGVEAGKHLSHDELLRHHHAVIYAVGALSDRHLGVPGEDLPGSYAATEFVAWYNGHPDYANRQFDLSSERAVVIGNGNVALDVARILVSDVDQLDLTDVADHAIAALRNSNIREVVIVGRRGPAQAAYTTPEFLALRSLPDVDIVIDSAHADLDPHSQRWIDSGEAEPSVRIKAELAHEMSSARLKDAKRRIVFRYLESPVEILGEERVAGVRVVRNVLTEDSDGSLRPEASDQFETIEGGLVLRSIGYRGTAIAGVPFDEARGTFPNTGGRVIDPETGDVVTGVYATGWIKRGPSGVIGTNKKCAADTVEALLADFEKAQLVTPVQDQAALVSLVRERQPNVVDFDGWTRIDKAEKAAAGTRQRSRVKFVDVDSMLAAARGNR
ncbi:FAD-dependent oxidoreductase (plasmid) [Rhodococcus pseudokoreensis]|uniref:ferredoxin--NADP(+) reductase n=1 Tax=Rhodococcus pseudokoreensis TaxID=2811421 RepID=A0A974ZRK7_9NOCA|nr:FAD-dependent oxidoreductase [Rhodococcus pseudokoreensis]QSE87507.1 FAD-dependent oxidoreductase [Rhodococcus pseudokoreensis]